MTVTAYDTYGNIATNYDFSTAATSSNLGDAPDASEAADDGDLDDNGDGTADLTGAVGYKAESGRHVTVTDSATNATSDSDDFAVADQFTVVPAAVDRYTFSTIGDVDAGDTIPSITVTAYDTYGNIATNYNFSTASVSTNLNGSTIGCGALAGQPCVVPAGALTNIAGTGTATITGLIGYKAESGRAVTVTDSVTDAENSSSPSFSVKSIEAAILTFVNQPIDTKLGAPTYNKCIAPATSVANPCSLPVAAGLDFDPTKSQPVRVLAQDRYGNIAITTEVKVRGSNNASPIGTANSNANGVASFPAISLISPALLSYTLIATKTTVIGTAPTPTTKTSNSFTVVSDLEACVDQACGNLATGGVSGKPQKTLGRITTGNDFDDGGNNVVLTTQFDNWTGGRCSTPKGTLGQTTEVRVQGGGVSPTSPNFSVTLDFPKDTIKKDGLTARSADSFDVCLGATWLNGTSPSPWKAKNLATGALVDALPETGPGANPLATGAGSRCAPRSRRARLTPAQKAANPCVILKTKQVATLKAELVTKQQMPLAEFNALGAKDSDVMIVVSKPWPWDGKFGTGLK